jgi:hypothetical protein
VEAVQILQKSHQQTDTRLQHLEEAGKVFAGIQQKMDDKVESIPKLLLQWVLSEGGSA